LDVVYLFEGREVLLKGVLFHYDSSRNLTGHGRQKRKNVVKVEKLTWIVVIEEGLVRL
jgi:hypothetical protein